MYLILTKLKYQAGDTQEKLLLLIARHYLRTKTQLRTRNSLYMPGAKSVVGTEFPQHTLGIETLSIAMHCSSHAVEWE